MMTAAKPKYPSFDFTDRVVCITGGGGFLGKEFVRAFVDAGARVVVVDLRFAEGVSSAHDYGGSEENTLLIKADVNATRLRNSLWRTGMKP